MELIKKSYSFIYSNKYRLSSLIAGFSLMVIELTASRILAPIVGATIYTWTSVIGIVLSASALGNYCGGKLIDKQQKSSYIAIFLLLSSAWTACIPFVSKLFSFLVLGEISLPLSVFILSFLLFFIPSFLISAVYPMFLRFSFINSSTLGKEAGSLSAYWSLGGIAGTFGTGFLFIGYVGSSATLFYVSIIQALLGVYFFPMKKKVFFPLMIIVVLIFIQIHEARSKRNETYIYNKESAYYNIKVFDSNKPPYRDMRLLTLDADIQGVESKSGISLESYPDMQAAFSVINPDVKKILVIGGGAQTTSKNLASHFKESRVTALEIDPQVAAVAEKYFNSNIHNVTTVIADGRIYLSRNDQTYDLIFSDAFNSLFSIPWHLSTLEFNELIKSRLNNNGVYALNLIASRKGSGEQFFESMLKTFSKIFPNYYIFAFNGKADAIQNIVLVGINSDHILSDEEYARKIAEVNDGILSRRIISKKTIQTDGSSLILTDDFSPNERLMATFIKQNFDQHGK